MKRVRSIDNRGKDMVIHHRRDFQKITSYFLRLWRWNNSSEINSSTADQVATAYTLPYQLVKSLPTRNTRDSKVNTGKWKKGHIRPARKEWNCHDFVLPWTFTNFPKKLKFLSENFGKVQNFPRGATACNFLKITVEDHTYFRMITFYSSDYKITH